MIRVKNDRVIITSDRGAVGIGGFFFYRHMYDFS